MAQWASWAVLLWCEGMPVSSSRSAIYSLQLRASMESPPALGRVVGIVLGFLVLRIFFCLPRDFVSHPVFFRQITFPLCSANLYSVACRQKPKIIPGGSKKWTWGVHILRYGGRASASGNSPRLRGEGREGKPRLSDRFLAVCGRWRGGSYSNCYL